MKIKQVLKTLGLNSQVKVYSGDHIFSRNSGILNFQPSKRTHWVCCNGDFYFDYFGCLPPKIDS